MECKSVWPGTGKKNKCRINRYIMECKSGLSVFTSVGVNELIDTLWNVNQRLGILF